MTPKRFALIFYDWAAVAVSVQMIITQYHRIAEHKRQQTIANGNMMLEMKKMHAAEKCRKVDDRAVRARS
eukprot:scaffold23779_cov44-Prasinocladus_malaysianus.AAC.1